MSRLPPRFCLSVRMNVSSIQTRLSSGRAYMSGRFVGLSSSSSTLCDLKNGCYSSDFLHQPILDTGSARKVRMKFFALFIYGVSRRLRVPRLAILDGCASFIARFMLQFQRQRSENNGRPPALSKQFSGAFYEVEKFCAIPPGPRDAVPSRMFLESFMNVCMMLRNLPVTVGTRISPFAVVCQTQFSVSSLAPSPSKEHSATFDLSILSRPFKWCGGFPIPHHFARLNSDWSRLATLHLPGSSPATPWPQAPHAVFSFLTRPLRLGFSPV
eukprot:284816406_1